MGQLALIVAHRSSLDVLALVVFLGTAIATTGLTIRRPAFGVGLLLACEPFDWTHDIGPTTLTLGKVALVGLIAGLAIRRTSLAPLRSAATRPIVLGALAILVATALSAIPATYIDATARETLKALEYVAVFAAVALAIREESDETRVLQALGVLALVVCGLALRDLTLAGGSGILIGGRTVARIAGPLEGPNQLAAYLDLIVPLFLARALDRVDVLARIVVPVAILTDVLTLSRSGLLGLAVGVVVVLLLRGRSQISARFLALAAGMVAVVALLATRMGFAGRYLSLEDVQRENGLGTRSELWTAAIALWRKDPALGVGAGNFELQLPSVGLIGVRTHANSLYLQTLAEGGIALFAATLWTFVAAIALAFRDAKRSSYLLGFCAAGAAFAIHQIYDFLTFFPKVGTLWWALVGLAVARIAAMRATQTQ